jgi:hypothetical protein
LSMTIGQANLFPSGGPNAGALMLDDQGRMKIRSASDCAGCDCDDPPPPGCFVNLLKCCPNSGSSETDLWMLCSIQPPNEPVIPLTVFRIGEFCYYKSSTTAPVVPPGGTFVPETAISQWYADCSPCCQPPPVPCADVIITTYGSAVLCSIDPAQLYYDFCDPSGGSNNEICGRQRWIIQPFALQWTGSGGAPCVCPSPPSGGRELYRGSSPITVSPLNCCPNQHPPGTIGAFVVIGCCHSGGFSLSLSGAVTISGSSFGWFRCYHNPGSTVFGTYLPTGPVIETGVWLSQRPIGVPCCPSPVGTVCSLCPPAIYPEFVTIS